MIILTVEDNELSQIISALAVTSVPLIAKLSQQAMAQKAKGNGDASEVGLESGNHQLQRARNDQSGPPAPASGGGSAEQRPPRPPRR